MKTFAKTSSPFTLALLLSLGLLLPAHSQTTPTGLAVTQNAQGQEVVTWTGVADATLHHYIVSREGASFAVSGGVTYPDSGLFAGTTYHYTVQSVNGAGQVSAVSAAVAATPTVTTASAGTVAATPGVPSPKGDGIADDTAALQTAAAYDRDNGGLPQLLPMGIYKLTSPLVLGQSHPGASAGTILQGPILRGLSGESVVSSVFVNNGASFYGGGVGLLMTTDNAPDVVEMGDGVFRFGAISDLSIDGGQLLHTAVGLNATYTHWSRLTVDRVSIRNVDTGVHEGNRDSASGGNGEYLSLSHCGIDARTHVYVNDTLSGQAFPITWNDVASTTTLPGGTYATAGGTGAGQQAGNNFTDLGLAQSFARENPETSADAQSALFRNYGMTGVYAFIGGRVERCGALEDRMAGTPSSSGTIMIQGITFADMDPYQYFLQDVSTSQDIVTISNDRFTSYVSQPLRLNIATNSGCKYNFVDCSWSGWSDISALQNDPHVTLTRCQYSAALGGTQPPLVHN